MKTSTKTKLGDNTLFKKTGLLALGRVIKTELDRLTVTAPPETVADEKLLVKLRWWMINDGFQDKVRPAELAQQYTTSILSMFDSADDLDDIKYFDNDAQGAIVIDPDLTEPIIINKIKTNGWLYGLANITAADFVPIPAE